MTYTQILIILVMHTIFDWIFQTRWQAENKSKNWQALSEHVAVYTIGLLLVGMILFPNSADWVVWAIGNGVLHFMTDAVTSRINAKLYPNKGFWNCIGIDQLIHYATLFGTFFLLT